MSGINISPILSKLKLPAPIKQLIMALKTMAWGKIITIIIILLIPLIIILIIKIRKKRKKKGAPKDSAPKKLKQISKISLQKIWKTS